MMTVPEAQAMLRVTGDDETIGLLLSAARFTVSTLAGRDADSSPETREAARRLLAHWHDRRETMRGGGIVPTLPSLPALLRGRP